MTTEDAKKHITENQPTSTTTDKAGRWTSRTWITENNTITERYEYQYSDNLILTNRDKSLYRDSFKVINTQLEII